MSIIYVLIPIAILLVLIAIAVFFWAVKSNQFEDLERQGYNILFDDDIKSHAKPIEAGEENEKSPSAPKEPL
ncbi:cbb3-type cytochrome oxidase assembly protein CcoS [Aliiglaciecola sp. LCG003]|uniref:cbb3-type cytochrome oxidase assembly protein CcoS n=1 Tax=Aliiglaciecola sp. LCG003 TaxID=3053655 RepID=UPI002572CE78|nr:cbb3-type cytochrome oxidase assembly protein CcoS [Aliiglaciecola sp. LCG003]WJG07603.1 cbb3-type cytochrome oxidase assembly protein CcoS [Aliiglaciecola sp. LCG003]